MDRKNEVIKLEWQLGLKFPQSYRQFLIERGSAVVDGYQIFGLPEEKEERKEREGILLSFQPGDPKRGFSWIAFYENRIVGLCSRPDCWYCNLEERKKLEDFPGGELKVELRFYQREAREFYIAHLISVPEPEKKRPKISVFEATETLRSHRRDIPKSFIAISAIKDRIRKDERVLCLDTATEQGVLFDVSLTKDEILPLNQTFQEWLEIHQGYERRFREAYQRIIARRKEAEEWRGRKFGGKRGLLPRPQDWHPIQSEVQDYIVGLTALRHNPRYNCLEVDEFYALDHPYYKKGEAIRNLTKIIFVMARDFSGSLSVIFTKERGDKKSSFFRPSRPVPQELVELAREYGVTFEKRDEGRISHQEGVKLFFALLEFPAEVQKKIEELEEAGYLSKEMVAEVIATGIWNREEAIWLFLNAPRPEAILLGSASAEHRPYQAEAMNYARSVLLATRLKQVIMLEARGGFSPEEKPGLEIVMEPQKNFWIMKGSERFHFPTSWMLPHFTKQEKPKIWVEANEPVLLLSRPRIIGKPEYNEAWLKEDIEVLLNSEIEAKKCLLVNYEFVSQDYNPDVAGIEEIVKQAAERGVYVLFPPVRTSILLDDEIEKRMRRARKMREFPLREGPLKLWVFEIPAYWWDIPSGAPDITRDAAGLRNASRDAIAFAGYIFKKVDIHRCRRQFAFNCEVVERIALCYPKSKRIGEFGGSESEEIIAALRGINALKGKRYDTITFSYVRPNEMPEFLSRIRGRVKEALSKVQGGIVVVPVPYEKLDTPLKKVEIEGKPFEIPEIILAKIDARIEERLAQKEYIGPEKQIEVQIRSAHQQIREALRAGLPLAVSWIQPAVFVQTIRDYLEYQEKRIGFFWKQRELSEPAQLRIVYNDGSEGKPFPLFCLREGFKRPENLLEHHSALVSLRHMEVDFFTENSIIRNREIQRRENAAEQEDIAFRKVYFFGENFLKLVRGETTVEEIEKKTDSLIFRVLAKELGLKGKKAEGVELHLYLATGLEPATVGGFRAVVELLRKYRGKLVVIPRIFTGKIQEKIGISTTQKRILEIRDINYEKAEAWF